VVTVAAMWSVERK